jgi:beta-lactamase class A
MMIFAQILLAVVFGCSSSDLVAEWSKIAAPAGGKVGAAAILLETNASVSMNSEEKFPMQSVYKVPIVMATLRRVDEGKLRLDQNVKLAAGDLPPTRVHSPIRDQNPRGTSLRLRELMRAAIVESDGAASDALLRLVPPAEVNQYLRQLGINDIMVLNTEKELGGNPRVQYQNWATPAAAVNLLRSLHEGKGISNQSRELLLSWMTATQTGARRVRAFLPKGAVVADKTGTSGTENGITAATNDIALVTLPNGQHMAIAVFVSDSKADQVVRESVIAEIARATWDCWRAK